MAIAVKNGVEGASTNDGTGLRVGEYVRLKIKWPDEPYRIAVVIQIYESGHALEVAYPRISEDGPDPLDDLVACTVMRDEVWHCRDQAAAEREFVAYAEGLRKGKDIFPHPGVVREEMAEYVERRTLKRLLDEGYLSKEQHRALMDTRKYGSPWLKDERSTWVHPRPKRKRARSIEERVRKEGIYRIWAPMA
jgi:hypothetical protein